MIKIDIGGIEGFVKVQQETIARVSKDKVKETALAIQAGVMNETPVDTGHARDNWQLEEAEDQSVVKNDVPYIGRLNQGHSKQAPSGYIDGVIDEVLRAMK